MIIWLNGPFGGGKTTVARELCERDESIVLFDPEEVGQMLRHFTLTVQPGEHERRILGDDEEPDAVDWRLARIPDFQRALPWLTEATAVVDTSDRTPAEIAALILEDVVADRH